ncbi:non-ribosomal peptide synthetase, partial [Protofrankia symbiont of Coriaria myrtifolia]
MDGGLALPVAMLGVLKTGAAFVPMDAAWPEPRRREALDQLDCPVTITADGSVGTPRCVRARAEPPARARGGALSARPRPHDVVYGFFTSGSTGRPKCALNFHRGLVNRLLTMSERFGRDGDVVLQNSSHVFDSAIWQLLWPLTRGCRVVIPERAGILDFESTMTTVERYGVTMTDFVPSVFDLFVETVAGRPGSVGRLVSLRRLLLGGEAMNAGSVQKFRALLPRLAVTNTFGPTEASIGSVFHDVTDEDVRETPIGRPIANTAVVLLGDGGHTVRQGEVGQIHLAGLCLGAGYHRDPRATRESFIDNPFPQVPGDRLYRTGDYGYVRRDGLLMFTGRRDDQIKIAGVRIDLNEIETTLRDAPGVQRVKTVVAGTRAQRSVVCFAVLTAGQTESGLLAYARSRLPAAGVPRRVVAVDRMPLLPNGKVDQVALRHRLTDEHRRTGEHGPTGEHGAPGGTTAPAPFLEAEILRLWRLLLPDATARTDFFRAGGTSLTAVRLALALERRFGVRLESRDLLGAPTLREQAALIVSGPGHAEDGTPLADVVGRDIFLHEPAAPPAPRRPAPGRRPAGPPRPETVLLTGATGFVGARLLAELTRRTTRTVVCLVRGSNDQEAGRRLDAALRAAGLRVERGRAVAVAGDLGLPLLGLREGRYHDLADEAVAVVHAGALINAVLDYERHRATNVDGTREVIRFAMTGRTKRLWHLSTVSVLGDGPPGPPTVDVSGRRHGLPADGYSQSKWTAEQLLERARSRGLPATVCRLGEVGADSRTGVGNPTSLVTLVLRLCRALDARVVTRASVDWAPVDRVARFIVEGLHRDEARGETFDLLGPGRVLLSELMARLPGPAARRPETVSYAQFHERALARAREDDLVARCLLALPPWTGDGADPVADVFTDATARFPAPRATQLARRFGLPWAVPRSGEIDTYLRWVVRDAPSAGTDGAVVPPSPAARSVDVSPP